MTAKYANVQKGVKKIMGGQILDYEAKDILNQGRAEGRAESRKMMIINALQNGSEPKDIAKVMNISLEEIVEIEKSLGEGK